MISPRVALVGTVLSGVTGTIATAAIADEVILRRRWWIVALLGLAVAAWAVGSWCALRLAPRTALIAVGVIAVGLRLAALSGPPPMSDDIYRYAFDAKVQLSGRSPYTHPPIAPEVADVRDSFLWPDDEACAELWRPPGCTRLNRVEVRTIYPPAAQAWFVVVRVLTFGADGDRPWQAAAMVVDLGLCGLLAWGLRTAGRDPRLAALWALSPVAVIEAVMNAHIEGVVALLCVGAVLAAQRRRDGSAGFLLGVATMMKLYPAVLLVAIGRRRPVLTTATLAATSILSYLPHVAFAGANVVGYLPGYLREEDYDSGKRFLLLRVVGLGGRVAPVVAALIFAGVVAWVWRRRPPIERGSCLILATLFLVLTPVQPWYAMSLAAIGVLAGEWRWSVVTIAGWPFYAAIILDHPHSTAIGTLSYGGAAAVLFASEFRRRISARPDAEEQPRAAHDVRPADLRTAEDRFGLRARSSGDRP